MEILYSDKNIAVIVKPVGLDSEHDVPAALTEQLGGEAYPGLIDLPNLKQNRRPKRVACFCAEG